MAFSTGTANSACDLMVALNTFLTANGWTKLDGETDIVPASPKSARYWRLLVAETNNDSWDFRQLQQLEWRTTSGGANVATTEANYSFSNLEGSSALVNGTSETISGDIDDAYWWVQYDFGVGTVVREIVISASAQAAGAPADFVIQWSNDERTWTTMFRSSGNAWANGETKTFTWDAGGGFTDSEHFSATVCRRTGEFPDTDNTSELCNDIWAWQGDGYDVTRRVYIGGITDYDLPTSYQSVKIFCTTDYDNTLASHEDQENFNSLNNVYLVFDSDPVTYWFYANDIRVIIVIKSGTDDYTCAYLGFLAAFAQPTEWAQPLYCGGTNDDAAPLSDASSRNSGFFDPGDNGCANWFDWNNLWVECENRADSSQIDLALEAPTSWIWPWHTGSAGDGNWPFTPIGDNDSFTAHWLDKLEPTEQNEMPIMPVILMDATYGNVGALDGVYAIPSGGLVTPEQTITLGLDTYRVFPNRSWRQGNHYWAILEV